MMISEHELRRMYRDEEMTQIEVAEIFGVRQATISRQMKLYNIQVRTNSEAKLGSVIKSSKEELGEMYCNKHMSTHEIASEIGVRQSTILNWMKLYGIKLRTFLESNAGENSKNWQGGISFEPYCNKFNDAFKESVRERDDYICQLCGHEQSSDERKLSVHHIHYDKENCYPDVVALCNSCNSKVNADRDYWEQYFENLLFEKGMMNWTVAEMI